MNLNKVMKYTRPSTNYNNSSKNKDFAKSFRNLI